MRGTAPDGGEVQLLVREARNGLALQRKKTSPRPRPSESAPSCSPSLVPGSWVPYGLAVLTPGCRLWVRGRLGAAWSLLAACTVGLGPVCLAGRAVLPVPLVPSLDFTKAVAASLPLWVGVRPPDVPISLPRRAVGCCGVPV